MNGATRAATSFVYVLVNSSTFDPIEDLGILCSHRHALVILQLIRFSVAAPSDAAWLLLSDPTAVACVRRRAVSNLCG